MNLHQTNVTRFLVLLSLLVASNGLACSRTYAQVNPSVDTDAQNFIQNRLKIELGDGRSANAMLVYYSPWVSQKQSEKPILPNYVYLYLVQEDAVALVDLGYNSSSRAKVEICKLTSLKVKITIDAKSIVFPASEAIDKGYIGYLFASLDWEYEGGPRSTDSWTRPATSTNPDFLDLVDRRLRLGEGLGVLNLEILEHWLVYATPSEEIWLYGRRFEPLISNQIKDTEAAVKLTHSDDKLGIEVTKNAAASITVRIDGKDSYTFPLTRIVGGVGLDVGYWITSRTISTTVTYPTATSSQTVTSASLTSITSTSVVVTTTETTATSSQTVTSASLTSITSTSVVVTTTKTTATSTSGTTAARCIIASAAYGSDLAPDVQFLRGFRDNDVMSTFAGSQFMRAFNAFYYSFSPTIAQVTSSNPVLQTVTRAVICPMIASLRFAAAIFELSPGSPHVTMIIAGIVASSLIGTICLSPVLILRKVVRRTVARVILRSQ